jgi:hypothetical protein
LKKENNDVTGAYTVIQSKFAKIIVKKVWKDTWYLSKLNDIDMGSVSAEKLLPWNSSKLLPKRTLKKTTTRTKSKRFAAFNSSPKETYIKTLKYIIGFTLCIKFYFKSQKCYLPLTGTFDWVGFLFLWRGESPTPCIIEAGSQRQKSLHIADAGSRYLPVVYI